jgi:hypothetical protein
MIAYVVRMRGECVCVGEAQLVTECRLESPPVEGECPAVARTLLTRKMSPHFKARTSLGTNKNLVTAPYTKSDCADEYQQHFTQPSDQHRWHDSGRCLPPPHLSTKTDPVSETLCSLEYRTMGKVQKPSNPELCVTCTCHRHCSAPEYAAWCCPHRRQQDSL